MIYLFFKYNFRYVIQVVDSMVRPKLLPPQNEAFVHLESLKSENASKWNFKLLFFSRERRVFEKYQKAARSMPDKKERDEIESLRGQVNID